MTLCPNSLSVIPRGVGGGRSLPLPTASCAFFSALLMWVVQSCPIVYQYIPSYLHQWHVEYTSFLRSARDVTPDERSPVYQGHRSTLMTALSAARPGLSLRLIQRHQPTLAWSRRGYGLHRTYPTPWQRLRVSLAGRRWGPSSLPYGYDIPQHASARCTHPETHAPRMVHGSAQGQWHHRRRARWSGRTNRAVRDAAP